MLMLVSLSFAAVSVLAQESLDDSLFESMVDQYVSESWKDRAQRQADLLPGINAEGLTGSFIYVGDYEVRHEVLLPLEVLDFWVPLDTKTPAIITVDEQDALAERVEEFFAGRAPAEIDGIEVEAILGRLDFYGSDADNLAQLPFSEDVSTEGAWAGVILSYSTKGTPSRVRVTWDLFNDRIQQVRCAVYAYDDNLSMIFTPESPVYVWTNPGRPPMLPINEIHAEEIPLLWAFWHDSGVSDSEAEGILTALLRNVYRAFDYRTESDVYDALAKSVDGELLGELYLLIHESLQMQEQGGAISRIQDVEILEGQRQSLPEDSDWSENGFGYRCHWTVRGTVEHWGHIHSRTNQYEAFFAVENRQDAWKIAELEVLSQERIKFESIVRQ